MNNCTTAAAFGYALEGQLLGEKALAQLDKAYQLCPRNQDLLFDQGVICLEQTRNNDCALAKFKAFTAAKKKLAKDHPVHDFIRQIKDMIEMDKAGPAEAPPDGPESPVEAAEGDVPPESGEGRVRDGTSKRQASDGSAVRDPAAG